MLIHGQVTLWETYQRVLPELAEHFHVYAVDCHGHGKSSKNPEDYNVEAMGEDFAAFIDQVITEPVIVTGNSSGGLLSIWLAANAPEHIIGIMPEAPPLFSSEYPRIKETFGNDLPNVSNNYITSGEQEEFLDYYLLNSQMMGFFGNAKQGVYDWVQSYRKQNPDEPANVFFLPLSMRIMFVGMDTYDPYFGQAFYTGEWHKNFDHAETLQRVEVPTLLIHTNWHFEDGILMAAMSGDDAAQANELLPDSELVKLDSGHSPHIEKPDEFIQLLLDFADDLGVLEE